MTPSRNRPRILHPVWRGGNRLCTSATDRIHHWTTLPPCRPPFAEVRDLGHSPFKPRDSQGQTLQGCWLIAITWGTPQGPLINGGNRM